MTPQTHQQQHRHHNQPIHPHAFLNTCIDDNNYKLLSILGVGAYGIVYQARHLKTGELYAVKLLTHSNKQNETEIHRLVSDHDNILKFIKRVDMGTWTFLVLEHAPHGDLFKALTHPSNPIIGNDRAIRHIFLQLLDAVQHCHTHHVAHRDLKPENILVFPEHHIKLADFGLATTHAVSAEFGCGSSFYFSPECQGGLIRNHQRIKGYGTQQNDIWSLGIILINLTTGRNPWKQANLNDSSFAAYCHANQPGFFRVILPSISNELEAILERIFCLDPARRIGLPELRLRILQCRSFTLLGQQQQRQQQVHVPKAPSSVFPPYEQPACTKIALSRSTVLDDIQAYATPFLTVSSSSSSIHHNECPATPGKEDMRMSLLSTATNNKYSAVDHPEIQRTSYFYATTTTTTTPSLHVVQ